MQKWLVLCCFVYLLYSSHAQTQLQIIPWETAKTMPVDSVFAIDASHLKWDSLPKELFAFRSLKYLNISRNKLVSLPMELGSLKQLTTIDASRNRISTSPIVICQLPELRKLLISRNDIASLPACVGYLQVLDIWDNPINELPIELAQIEGMKKIDMRGIQLSPGFQDKWQKTMPWVKWYFDAPCHCVD